MHWVTAGWGALASLLGCGRTFSAWRDLGAALIFRPQKVWESHRQPNVMLEQQRNNLWPCVIMCSEIYVIASD